MMKRKQIIRFVFVAVMAMAIFLSGCGSNSETVSKSVYTEGKNSAPSALLTSISGTYEELFPVLLEKKYDTIWFESCKNSVGEENAQAAVDMLKQSMSGTEIGTKAETKYASSPEKGLFHCGFTQGVQTFIFDGSNISGIDKNGEEIFSHTYSYVSYNEELDFYVFKSDDEDSGEFTYFLLRGDTPFSTYHIEFRYGSDLKALQEFVNGDYAYWMAAGIIENCDENMIKNCIELFCTENLSSEEQVEN